MVASRCTEQPRTLTDGVLIPSHLLIPGWPARSRVLQSTCCSAACCAQLLTAVQTCNVCAPEMRSWLAGDFEPSKMQQLIEAEFGQWQVDASQPQQQPVLPTSPLPTPQGPHSSSHILLIDRPDATQVRHCTCDSVIFRPAAHGGAPWSPTIIRAMQLQSAAVMAGLGVQSHTLQILQLTLMLPYLQTTLVIGDAGMRRIRWFAVSVDNPQPCNMTSSALLQTTVVTVNITA